MDKIIVTGGCSLDGEVTISGAKNAALPILISSLLAKGHSCYTNVPNLKDIESAAEILEHLGAKITRTNTTIEIDTSGELHFDAPYDLVRKMRASILVLGPLVARLKKARVSLPGGCAIGARPVDQHLKGLEQMGAKITLDQGYIEVEAEKLRGADILFDMITVTGTENLLMAAVLAEGKTVLRNAAMEPEIVALASALKQMGACISGEGTPVITIEGCKELTPVSVEIIPDRIEAGTFMVAAAITKGDVKIKNCRPDHLESVIDKLRLTGSHINIVDDTTIWIKGASKLTSVDLKTQPYPGFPTDMQAQFMVLMLAATGVSVISETIFENRFIHVSELHRMGADIQVNGNTAVVKGGQTLSGAPVMATDLRASASLILAGLIAQGVTEVSRVYHLDRGYDSLEAKFKKLGASVERVRASV